eukprot:557176-Pelagomonas_calceolata.AAC.1
MHMPCALGAFLGKKGTETKQEREGGQGYIAACICLQPNKLTQTQNVNKCLMIPTEGQEQKKALQLSCMQPKNVPPSANSERPWERLAFITKI